MARQPEISFIPEAFILSDESKKYQILWQDIVKIVAYKVDMWSVDEIRIDIELTDKFYTITEEFHNWDQFIKIIETKFLIEDWFPQVAFPPFERNETILFERNNI